MAVVRQDQVQLRVDIITDESRQLAGTIQQTDRYQAAIAASTREIREHQKALEKVKGDEEKRVALLGKIAAAEKEVAKNQRLIAEEAKKVERIDLNKLTPAQLIQRTRQLATAIREIPQSAPEFAKLNAELKRTNDQLVKVRDSAKSVSAGGGGGGGGLGGLLAKGAGIFGAIGAFVGSIAGIVNATRETEKLFAVLKNGFGGNEAKALQVFQQLQDFAATTPFALNEVVGAFNKLQQRNFNPTIAQLRAMGDIAAASGKSIDQFVEAVLDAQTGEFERLKEFGVVVRKNGDELTASFRGQSETFKNSSENINKYLLSLGQLPGILGSTDAVAATVDGSISNLGDNFTRLFASIGSSNGILKGFIDFLNQIIGGINRMISAPLSEKLREQQSEFNGLVAILKDVNSSEDTRNRAIAQLQQKYPDFIGNINLQKASENDLNKILEEGNKIFTKRIFLQQQNEKLEEFAKNQLTFQKLIFDTQKRLNEARARPDSERGFFDRSQANDIKYYAGQLESYKNTLGNVNQEQAAFLVQQKEFADQFNIDTTPEATTGGAGGGGKALTPAGVAKKEADAAVGSLAFFRKHVADLQKQIEQTPGDPKVLEPLLKQLAEAEQQIASLEAQIAGLRNPEQAPSLGDLSNQTAVFGEGGSKRPEGIEAQNQAELERIVEFNDAKLEAETEYINDVDALRQFDSEKNKARLEADMEFEEQMRATRLQAVRAGIQLGIDLLGQDAAARKKHGAAIKALEIANVGVNLAAEISSIRRNAAGSPINILFPGYSGIFSAIQIGIAVAQAAAQTARIVRAKYERGGIAKLGYFGGRSHADGGTKGYFDDGTQIEVERGEAFAVVNKRNAPLLRMLSNVNAMGGNGVPFFEKGGLVQRFAFGGLPSVNTTPIGAVGAAQSGVPGLQGMETFVQAVGMFGEIIRAMPRNVKARVVLTELQGAQKELGDVQNDAAI